MNDNYLVWLLLGLTMNSVGDKSNVLFVEFK